MNLHFSSQWFRFRKAGLRRGFGSLFSRNIGFRAGVWFAVVFSVFLHAAVPVRRVLMVVAPGNFRDEELFTPRKMFEEQGLKVVVASTTTHRVFGMLKGAVTPDVLLREVDVADYDAVVFVGGMGATRYFTNEQALRLARETTEKGKVLGAICLAPNILACSGVLAGKKATCWGSPNLLTKHGAVYIKADVVRDGRIVTANGPRAAARFARLILKVLSETR